MQLTATGAEPPYAWNVTGATSQVTGNDTVKITLGADPATINVTLTDAAGRTLTASFSNNGPLTLSPAGPEITVGLDSETQFAVQGGDSSYTWAIQGGDVDNPSAANVTYKAPGLPGVYHVTVSDGSGASASVTVKSGVAFRVTPHCARVQRGASAEFQVVSGNSPYVWEAEFGALSATSGEKVGFTPEATLGLYTLRAYDSAGAVVDLCVEVIGDGPVIQPSAATVIISTDKLFKVVSGIAPYTWTAERGTVLDGKYTAPASAGSDTMTVTDATGAKATVTIEVIKGSCSISPTEAIVGINGNQSFKAGIDCNSPYSWTVVRGNVLNGEYTAPSSIGSDEVIVTDAFGNSATATVNVIKDGIAINPSSVKIGINTNKSFTVVGGVAPFQWNAERGDVSSNGNYTSPGTVGPDTVTVTNATGAEATATIDVTKKLLRINPSITAVNADAQSTFTAIGGDGNYTWSVKKGSLSDKGTTVTYTAPALAGDDELTLTDGSGGEVKAKIRVLSAVGNLSITPAKAKLSANETQKFIVHNAIGNISWTASGGNIASDGTYTAPASMGSYTIVATDLQSSRNVKATVMVGAALNLTPTEKKMHTGDSANFSVNGGEAPYSWRVIGDGFLDGDTSEIGEEVRFTAGVTTGKVTLLVADNKSLSSEATITVVGEMLITPENVILPRGGSQTFQVSGGTGDITWIADYGNIDNAGNYTAPDGLGTYVVTASDTAGNKASVNIVVSDVIPVITPASAWLQKGGKTTLEVIGGTPPYRWEASVGSISGNGNTVTYQAPKLSSDVTITVTDNLGNESKASVYVDLPLMASREEIFVRPGQTARVSVVGGIPAFDWQTGMGEMKAPRTEEQGTNLYTAPNIYGDDIITVRDQKGDTTTVAVHVIPLLLVTPHKRFMEREKTKQFTVASGVPPYTAVVTGEGDIEPAKSDDGHFKFTSGSTADKDIVIEFRDNVAGDEQRVVKVHVYVERQLRVSPLEMLHVPFGNEKKFRATGGTGDFFVVADRGYAEIDPETGDGIYIAPGVKGDSNLTVVDSSDQEIVVTTKIGHSPPFISPSIATLVPGETRSFMVSRGAPKYEWSFDGNRWQGMDSQNSVVQITAPLTAGVYNLSVEDAKGYEAQAAITVIQPLIVSPVSHVVYRGVSDKLRFEKRGGSGGCDWILTDLDEVEKGDKYIVVRTPADGKVGKEYTVRCRDQNGEMAQSKIVVANLSVDLNGDGIISEEEILICIEKYFNRGMLNGVTIDRQVKKLN